MLFKQTVDQTTLELLNELASNQVILELGFALAGGTALALQFGHRRSIDIDFFTLNEFNDQDLLGSINVLNPKLINQSKNTLSVIIRNVKTEFIRHNYPLLNDRQKLESIPVYSVEDISAMKLNALINRGSKKDFFDLRELLDHYSLDEIIEFFGKKYQPGSKMMILKSLNYFSDADREPDPIVFNKRKWNDVKAYFRELIASYL